MDESALKALDRKALQKLAKTNGIKANLKSSEIIKQLLASRPSQRSSPLRRPAASSARHRVTAPHQPQPNDLELSPPREDEDEPVPVFPPAASSRARETRRPTTRAQPPTSKPRQAQSRGGRSASSKAPRTHAPPHQPPSSSPPPGASQGRLPSFDQHLSAVCQAEAGPSRSKGKAPILGIFNESSASRAPWPQERGNLQRQSLAPSSPPAGPSKTLSKRPTQTHATHPAPVAGSSASASRHRPIVPEPGYRSRSPTPLEEYDSMRGVPLFPEPASDYEESWTPYSSLGQPSHGGHLQAPAGSGAQPAQGHPDGPSPVFPLSRAVFSPAKPVLAPARSPVFRAPSNPRRRPTNPVGRDEDSPKNDPEEHREDDGAAHDAGDELEDDDDDEEEEDEAHKLATDEQLYKMVVRLATVARHQAAMQPGIDNIVEEVNGVQAAAPRLRAQVRQERASFERMRAFLAHVNTRVGPAWDHAAIWDTACVLREDEHGNELEVETSDEEEAQWRRDNPRPPKALPTKIEMRRITPWFPGVCEDEDRENVRDIGEAIEKCRAEWKEVDAVRARAAAAQLDAPSTPKRRRGADDEEAEEDGGRAKKKVRGSAGRTPPPSAFFQQGQKGDGADAKKPLLVGIAEEDAEEEEVDMVMTSVV